MRSAHYLGLNSLRNSSRSTAQQVLNFAAEVHLMARSGDSTAIAESITAVAWIFAGAGEIVRQKKKALLN